MPLRQHDIILAEGSFQVVLTNRRRLFAVINAPQTALGPMRIALEVVRDEGLPIVNALAEADAVAAVANLLAHPARSVEFEGGEIVRGAGGRRCRGRACPRAIVGARGGPGSRAHV
jgi:hypothetical protein